MRITDSKGFKKSDNEPPEPSNLLLKLVRLYKSLGMKVERESGCSYVLRLPNAVTRIGVLYQSRNTIYIKYDYPFSEIETLMPKTLIIPDALAIADGFLGTRGIPTWVVGISWLYDIPEILIEYDYKSITIPVV